MGKEKPKTQDNEAMRSSSVSLKERLPGFLKDASNPGICILTFIFKVGALVSYLLLNIFVSNLVLVYIIVICLQAFDFYVVKNITGR